MSRLERNGTARVCFDRSPSALGRRALHNSRIVERKRLPRRGSSPEYANPGGGSSGGGRLYMAVLPSPVTHSGWRRLWEVASDLLIATALIWTLPLLLGAALAVARLLMDIW